MLWLLALWGLVLGLGALFSSEMRTTVTLAGLSGRTVILDPGHGGRDPGAVGHGGREDRVVLAICQDLKSNLAQAGVTVLLTRNGNSDLLFGRKGTKKLELSRRVEMVNKSGADVFLSIHANAGTSSAWHGAQVFIDQKATPESKNLGLQIQEALRQEVGTKRALNWGINHYLLKKATIPVATVEVGFMSNPKEARLLQTDAYQKRLAKAIYRGLLAYFASVPPALRGSG